MHSRPERVIGHTGTETRPSTPTGGSSRESSAMDESLTEQRRVYERRFSDRKVLLLEKNKDKSNCLSLDGI